MSQYQFIAALLGAALVISGCGADGPDYDVANARWSVRLVAAQHSGQPIMRIRVNDAHQWPLIDDAQAIRYQVRLVDADGARVSSVGWVDQQSRRGVAVIVSDWVAAELNIDPVVDAARIEPRALALTELIKDTKGTTIIDVQALFDAADKVELTHGLDAHFGGRMDERLAVESYQLELVPFRDGVALAHDSGNRHSPQRVQLEWSTPLSSFPGCASGETAEQCASKRVQAFATIVCDARTETSMVRFPSLCAQIEQRLARDVEEPSVACALPDESGVSASGYDPTTDIGTINGGHILAGFDGDSAILHQLVHAQDRADNLLSSLVLVRGAEADFVRSLAAGRGAAEAGDYDEARLQADKLIAAAATLEQSEQGAASELIDSECRALFTTLDSADLFGYPDFGNAWLFGTLINGVAELAGMRRDFYLTRDSPAVASGLCSCLSLVADWIDQRPIVKAGLSQTTVFADPSVSASDLVGGLAASYCGS